MTGRLSKDYPFPKGSGRILEKEEPLLCAQKSMATEQQHIYPTSLPVHDAMGPWQRGVKRLFDVVGACVGMVCLSPAFLYAYIVVRRRGAGAVIFRQERIGRGGRPFVIYKFRTMENAGEEQTPELVSDSDERLTEWGKRLREHHLDELPQLWNVVKGDMSLVGPRPERKYFIDKIMERDNRYAFLYAIRPGITSKATIYNGYTDTMEKMLRRLEMDLEYLSTRTLLLDFKIIMETLLPLLRWRKI